MGPVNVVREDPRKRGLLFAGTEREVVFSADDGEHWQPLRMNMPASSIRDLVIKDDDLVIGTHGRSIWILDNIAPLRQLAEAARASGAVPVRAGARHAGALEHVLRHAAAAGGADRREPAGRRDPGLPPAARGEERHAGDRGGGRRSDPAATRAPTSPRSSIRRRCHTRPTGCARISRCEATPGHHRFVWDLRYTAAPRDAPHARDRRRLPEDAERSGGAVRPSRFLHGASDRGRRRSGSGRSKCGSIRA